MIRLENVTKYYQSNQMISVGVRRINLEFSIGEFIAITGESGSGKSTLLNILSGLDTFEEGEFFLFDQSTSHFSISEWEQYRASYVGFVFQNYNIIDSYTVFQNVLLALEFQGYDPIKRIERANELIDQVGLSHRKNHRASKLSGGEKQRTVIARALAKDCPAIFCDEPTGNLDSQSAKDILKLLHNISKDKLVIIVTHNYDEVKPYADRQIRMSDGEIIEDIDYTHKSQIEQEVIEIQPKQVDFKTTMGIAFRNLMATPKRLLFFLTMQFIFALLVVLVFGAIISLGYQEQIIEDRAKVSQHQIKVYRHDQKHMTNEEINQFLNNRYVEAVDIETIHQLFVTAGYYVDEIPIYDNQNLFTERASLMRSSNIIRGYQPQNIGEVLISQDIALRLNRESGDLIILRTLNGDIHPFVVSGITDRVASSVYFHDAFFNDDEFRFQSIVQTTGILLIDGFAQSVLQTLFQGVYPDVALPIGYGLARVHYNQPGLRESSVRIGTGYQQTFEISVEIDYYFTETTRRLYLNPDTYQALKSDILTTFDDYIVTLSVYDQLAAQKFLNQADKNTYVFTYEPFVRNTEDTSFGVLLKIGSYGAVVAIAFLLFLLIGFIFKQMIKNRRKDFAIYRSVGANRAFVSHLMIAEQIIQIAMGTVLTIIIIYFTQLQFDQLHELIKYMGAIDMIIIFMVFALMSLHTPLKYSHMVFEISVIDTLRSSLEV